MVLICISLILVMLNIFSHALLAISLHFLKNVCSGPLPNINYLELWNIYCY